MNGVFAVFVVPIGKYAIYKKCYIVEKMCHDIIFFIKAKLNGCLVQKRDEKNCALNVNTNVWVLFI